MYPSVFVQHSWLSFIKQDKNAEIIMIEIQQQNKIGFFIGLLFKKYGFRFIGSPFTGWSTPYFNIVGEINLDANLYFDLFKYIKKVYHPLLIEVVHKDVDEETATKFVNRELKTLILDITQDEKILFQNFKQDARNFIRQFEKKGSRIEISTYDIDFSTVYYNQLIDVFQKQNLRPTYDKLKVDNLINNLRNTDNILCLKVFNPDNICIASSIFIGDNDTFYFWGGASYREYQSYRPNEAMIWFAIKYWKNKGLKNFDMVGVRDYKRKFGPNEYTYYRLYISAFPFVVSVRNIIEKIYYRSLKRK